MMLVKTLENNIAIYDVDDARLKIVDESNDPGMIFAPNTPLSVQVPQFQTSVDRTSGITLNIPEDIVTSLSRDYIQTLLEGATASLSQPVNVRSTPENKADGSVPLEFRKRSSRMMGRLDLTSVIMSARGSTEVTLTGKKPMGAYNKSFQYLGNSAHDIEVADMEIVMTAAVKLKLDHSFWRGLLDVKNSDFGYVTYSAAGRYGQVEDLKLPEDKALAMLTCGTLSISRANKGDDKFDKLIVSVDLAGSFGSDDQRLTTNLQVRVWHLPESSTSCLLVEQKAAILFGSDRLYHFCGNKGEIAQLQKAIKLQLVRFADVPRALWTQTRAALQSKGHMVPEHWTSTMDRNSNQDATWFQNTSYPEQQPPASMDEVMSPGMLWDKTANPHSENLYEGPPPDVEFPNLQIFADDLRASETRRF